MQLTSKLLQNEGKLSCLRNIFNEINISVVIIEYFIGNCDMTLDSILELHGYIINSDDSVTTVEHKGIDNELMIELFHCLIGWNYTVFHSNSNSNLNNLHHHRDLYHHIEYNVYGSLWENEYFNGIRDACYRDTIKTTNTTSEQNENWLMFLVSQIYPDEEQLGTRICCFYIYIDKDDIVNYKKILKCSCIRINNVLPYIKKSYQLYNNIKDFFQNINFD